jgi:hypothetical protein
MYGRLGCNVALFGKSPTFRRSILLPSSWLKSKPNEKQARRRGSRAGGVCRKSGLI